MNVAELLAHPDFLQKLAQPLPNEDVMGTEDMEAAMLGIIEFMKDAGWNPLYVMDMFNGFLPDGQKVAQEAGAPSMLNPANWFRKGVDNLGAKAIEQSNPTAYKFLNGLYDGDKGKILETGLQYQKGEYGPMLKNLWGGVTNNSMVKKWAPYVVPAVATFAAGKLMGMGTGGAAALGLGVGAAGGYAHGKIKEHGSVQNYVNNGIQKRWFPKSNSGQPWIKHELDANGLRTSVPDPTLQTRNHAENVGAAAAPKPPTVAGVTPTISVSGMGLPSLF